MQYAKRSGRNTIEADKYIEEGYKKIKVLEDEYEIARNQDLTAKERRRLRNKKTALKSRIKDKEKMLQLVANSTQ